MEWFSFIGFSILVTVIFGLLYFVINEYLRYKGNRLNQFEIFKVGIFVFLFIFLTTFFLSKHFNDPSVYLSIGLVFVILIPIFLDKRLLLYSFGSLFLALFLIVEDYNNVSNYLLIFDAIFLLLSSILITNNIFKTSKTTSLIAFTSLFLIFSLTLQYVFVLNSFNASEVALAFFTIASFYICFVFINTFFIHAINNFYKKIFDISNLRVQDYSNFIKTSISSNFLEQQIIDNKIQNALYITFFFEKEPSKSELSILANNFSKLFPDSYFFKPSLQDYSAFIKITSIDSEQLKTINEGNNLKKRKEDDTLKEIEELLINTSNELKIKIKTTCSIFGIHSSSFSELNEYNNLLMSSWKTTFINENIIMFDYLKFKDELLKRLKISQIRKVLKNHKLHIVESFSKRNIYYPILKVPNEQNLFNIIEHFTTDVDLFFSYFSLRTIKEFSLLKLKGKLLIYYSPNLILSDDFELNKFVSTISKYVNHKQVIIGLNFNNISKTNIEKIFKKISKYFEVCLITEKVDDLSSNLKVQYKKLVDEKMVRNLYLSNKYVDLI